MSGAANRGGPIEHDAAGRQPTGRQGRRARDRGAVCSGVGSGSRLIERGAAGRFPLGGTESGARGC